MVTTTGVGAQVIGTQGDKADLQQRLISQVEPAVEADAVFSGIRQLGAYLAKKATNFLRAGGFALESLADEIFKRHRAFRSDG